MRDGYDTSPLNPLPPAVWLVLLPIIAFEVVLNLGPLGLAGGAAAGWRNEAVMRFALHPGMLAAMAESGRWQPDLLWRFMTYSFVHLSPMHALMVGVYVLALGKFVGSLFRPWAFVAIFLGSGIIGGLVYSLVPWSGEVWLVGGYPAAYGLIGTFSFVIWARLGAEGANRAQAFRLIGFLLAIKLVYGILFGGSPYWIADIAGFAAGFGLSFLMVPGGPARLLAMLRRR